MSKTGYIFAENYLYLHGALDKSAAGRKGTGRQIRMKSMNPGMAPHPGRVIDYERSAYRTEFWEQADRRYEDAAERLALQRLLPQTGRRLVDLGAGFGRLGQEYAGYDQVVLFDYSRSMLRQAVERWGRDPRFVFVAGNIYRMPLAAQCMDAVVMIRVMHHLERSQDALRQIDRILRGTGTAVLEFANKRNLKSILRRVRQRQAWSPFAEEPVEFAEMHFNFHPNWMRRHLAQTHLACQEVYSVSNLRVPTLKRWVPAPWLARADAALFRIGGFYPLGPSVFLRAVKRIEGRPAAVSRAAAHWLRCPTCPAAALAEREADLLACSQCGAAYRKRDGIWDFKAAVQGHPGK